MFIYSKKCFLPRIPYNVRIIYIELKVKNIKLYKKNYPLYLEY